MVDLEMYFYINNTQYAYLQSNGEEVNEALNSLNIEKLKKLKDKGIIYVIDQP